MLEKFLNIFRIPDLRKRVLFTLGILAVYRLGSHIPTPGVNGHLLEQLFNQQSGSALGLMDLFGGGNLRRMTVFALGIMPYITASDRKSTRLNSSHLGISYAAFCLKKKKLYVF